ncbi:MAG: hypothetical protein K8T25_02550 [Planctomycetia bacterium]|nr:hypothetical protein [Planctomycetia bacterium]
MKWWIIGGVAWILAILIAIGLFYRYREDPRVTEIKRMQDKLVSNTEDGRGDWDKRREMRAKMEALPEKERETLDSEMREKFMERREKMEAERLKAFYAMSKEDRNAALDKLITDQEAQRKESEKRRAERQAQQAIDGDQRVLANQQGPPSGNDGANGQRPGGNGNRGRGGWMNMTADQRKQMTRKRLDTTTPEFRAQRTAFVQDVQARRKELGLPPASTRALFGMFPGGSGRGPSSSASAGSATNATSGARPSL